MYHQFSTKYIEMKKNNNTNYKTMAQSLNEEVVDTIMFQE
jgi:hypothetical protein